MELLNWSLVANSCFLCVHVYPWPLHQVQVGNLVSNSCYCVCMFTPNPCTRSKRAALLPTLVTVCACSPCTRSKWARRWSGWMHCPPRLHDWTNLTWLAGCVVRGWLYLFMFHDLLWFNVVWCVVWDCLQLPHPGRKWCACCSSRYFAGSWRLHNLKSCNNQTGAEETVRPQFVLGTNHTGREKAHSTSNKEKGATEPSELLGLVLHFFINALKHRSAASYYNTHTLKPFKDLGLDSQRVKKLATKLHVHSVNFAAKLVHTGRALSNTVIDSHQEPVSGQACNPLDPHWFYLSFSQWRSFTVLGTKVAPFP